MYNSQNNQSNYIVENSMLTGLQNNLKDAIEAAGVDVSADDCIWQYPEIIKDNLVATDFVSPIMGVQIAGNDVELINRKANIKLERIDEEYSDCDCGKIEKRTSIVLKDAANSNKAISKIDLSDLYKDKIVDISFSDNLIQESDEFFLQFILKFSDGHQSIQKINITDILNFEYKQGDGLNLVDNVFSIKLADDTLELTNNGLKLSNSYINEVKNNVTENINKLHEKLNIENKLLEAELESKITNLDSRHSSDISVLHGRVAASEDRITGVVQDALELLDDTKEIKSTIETLTNTVEGRLTNVEQGIVNTNENLATNYYTKSEVYNKEEINKKVDDIYEEIGNNDTDIVSLTNIAAGISVEMVELSGNVSEFKEHVKNTYETKIAAAETKSYLDNKIIALGTTVANNKTDIEDKLATLEAKVDENETDIEGKLATLEAKVNENETDIEAKVDKNKNDIININATITALFNTDIKNKADLESEIAKLETKVDSNKNSLDAQIENINNTITSNHNTINKIVANNKAELESQISDLKTTVAGNKAAIEGTVSELTQTVADNKAAIENTVSELTQTVANNKTELENAISTLGTTVANNKTELENAISTLGTNLQANIDKHYNDAYQQLNDTINALDVSDSVVTGQYISSVSQTDGKISIERKNLLDYTAEDFENYLSVSENGIKLSGIDTAIATAKSEAIADADSKLATAKSELESYADSLANTAESNTAQVLTDAKTYADSLAVNYDVKGSATTAETNAKAYADNLAVNYDVKGSATTAETNAKTYADGLAVNYDTKGSAAQALTDAKAHSDSNLATAKTYAEGKVSELNNSIVGNYVNSETFVILGSRVSNNETNIQKLNSEITSLKDTDTDLRDDITEQKRDISLIKDLLNYRLDDDEEGLEQLNSIAKIQNDIDTLEDNVSTINRNLDALGTSIGTTLETAKSYAEAYADGLASNYDAAGSATNVKKYVDSDEYKANFDAKGSAGQALINANAYTDNLYSNVVSSAEINKRIDDAKSTVSNTLTGNIEQDTKDNYTIHGTRKYVDSQVSNTKTELEGKIVNATTDMATNAGVDTKLDAYSTTEQMNSAIATATTDMATNAGVDTKLDAYSTTEQMNSAIATAATTVIEEAKEYTDSKNKVFITDILLGGESISDSIKNEEIEEKIVNLTLSTVTEEDNGIIKKYIALSNKPNKEGDSTVSSRVDISDCVVKGVKFGNNINFVEENGEQKAFIQLILEFANGETTTEQIEVTALIDKYQSGAGINVSPGTGNSYKEISVILDPNVLTIRDTDRAITFSNNFTNTLEDIKNQATSLGSTVESNKTQIKYIETEISSINNTLDNVVKNKSDNPYPDIITNYDNILALNSNKYPWITFCDNYGLNVNQYYFGETRLGTNINNAVSNNILNNFNFEVGTFSQSSYATIQPTSIKFNYKIDEKTNKINNIIPYCFENAIKNIANNIVDTKLNNFNPTPSVSIGTISEAEILEIIGKY